MPPRTRYLTLYHVCGASAHVLLQAEAFEPPAAELMLFVHVDDHPVELSSLRMDLPEVYCSKRAKFDVDEITYGVGGISLYKPGADR